MKDWRGTEGLWGSVIAMREGEREEERRRGGRRDEKRLYWRLAESVTHEWVKRKTRAEISGDSVSSLCFLLRCSVMFWQRPSPTSPPSSSSSFCSSLPFCPVCTALFLSLLFFVVPPFSLLPSLFSPCLLYYALISYFLLFCLILLSPLSSLSFPFSSSPLLSSSPDLSFASIPCSPRFFLAFPHPFAPFLSFFSFHLILSSSHPFIFSSNLLPFPTSCPTFFSPPFLPYPLFHLFFSFPFSFSPLISYCPSSPTSFLFSYPHPLISFPFLSIFSLHLILSFIPPFLLLL